MPTGLFLPPGDLESFEDDRQTYGRRVRALAQTGKPLTQPLEEVVADRAASYMSERAHGFYCMGIEVFPGDGMSWAATSADSAIEDNALRAPRFYLRGRPGAGPEPALATVISMRKIAASAQRGGIATSARLLGTRRYAVIILAAVGVGAAGSILSALMAGDSGTSLTWGFAGLAIASAAFGMVAQLINQRLSQDSPKSPLVKIAEDIAAQSKAEQPGDDYWSFVSDLAGQLGKFAGFRCLIVDDFTNLDNLTRHVLEVYLRDVAGHKNEYWIVLYSALDKRLEFLVNRPERVNRKPAGYKYTHLYRLEHLDADQRRRLAEAYGFPERAGFLTVRAIACDDSGLDSLAAVCQQEHDARGGAAAGVRDSDALDFVYLFAVNAIWAGNPWMNTYDVRSGFSRQTRFRSRILQQLLPGFAATPTAITRNLDAMLDTFFPLAGEVSGTGRQRTFHVAPEAGEYFERSWRKYDLASPGMAHLFWAQYWSDTELHGTPNVALLRKISHHLLKSVAPADLPDKLKMGTAEVTAFTDELFNTTLEVLRACIKACLLTDVPDLMSYALRLADDDREAVERRRRARLRPLAWQAYGLLGDERVLGVILDLDPAARLAGGMQPASDSSLLDLFVRSIPSADGDAGRLMRGELSRRGMARHAGAYAVTKAGWLAASLSPFLGSASPTFMAAARGCREQLPAVVRASVDNLEKVADQEWQTTDILNVVLGLWSLGLAADSYRASSELGWGSSEDVNATFVDSLVRTCVLAIELSEQRLAADPGPAALDLVLDCLAEELLAVVLAIGLLSLARWPSAAWSAGADRKDVVAVVTESARALGLTEQALYSDDGQPSARLIEDTARRMTLLTVLWRRLGFSQLASFMAIRQAQFSALSYRIDASLAQSTIALLGQDLEESDQVGLLAHLAAAEGTMFSLQLMSSLVTRCCQLSIRVGFSERTSAELCMTAISHGHSFDIDFSATLDFLLGTWSQGGQRRLETLLAEVSDEHVVALLLALLNIINRDKTDRADRVFATLERRIAGISDAEVSKQASGHLRVYAVRRHLLAGQSADVDIDVELDAWQELGLRDLPTYGFLLSILLPLARQGTRERVLAESLDVLRAGGDYLRESGYVYLADNVFRQLRKNRPGGGADDAAAVALAALRAGFATWEKTISAEMNLHILRLLSRNDHEHADEYGAKYREWQQIILELDETRRLPELVGQGRFFLLLWHYFEFFADFGLLAEPPADPDGLDDREVAEALQQWRSGVRVPPDALAGRPGEELLSGDFLRLGYALFHHAQGERSGDQMTETELESARRQFDDKARAVIDVVYQMIGRLPRVPGTFELILRRHETFVRQRLGEMELSPTR